MLRFDRSPRSHQGDPSARRRPFRLLSILGVLGLLVGVAACGHAGALTASSSCAQFLRASAAEEDHAVKTIGLHLGNTMAGDPLEPANISNECGQAPNQTLGALLAPASQSADAPSTGVAASADYSVRLKSCRVSHGSLIASGSFTNSTSRQQDYSLLVSGTDRNGNALGSGGSASLETNAQSTVRWKATIESGFPFKGPPHCMIDEVLYAT